MQSRFALLIVATTLPFVPFFQACKSAPGSAQDGSDLDGIGDIFRSIPIPSAKSSEQLRALVKKIAKVGASQGVASSSSQAPKANMKEALIGGILEVDGLPRWQISQVLEEVLSPKTTLCAGVSCNRIFQMDQKEIDGFLDSLYKEVESSPTLKKSENAAKRKILLGSLKKEEKNPSRSPSSKVSFKDASIEQIVAKRLNINPPVTYGDLAKVTDLELDTWRLSRGRSLPKLDDLAMIPNLKKFTLRYHGTTMPTELAKYGKNIREIHLDKYSHIEHRIHAGIPVTLRELDGFATNTNLKSLSVNGFYPSELDGLTKKFFHLESLNIGLQEKLSDAMVASLSRMPNLRKFGIGVAYDSLQVSSGTKLPKSITAVHYNGANMRGCGDLAALQVFSLASTMTISNCRIGALGNSSSRFEWQILDLKDCTKDGGPSTKIFVQENLPKLRIFTSNRPYDIDLEDVSKKELAIRLAQDGTN